MKNDKAAASDERTRCRIRKFLIRLAALTIRLKKLLPDSNSFFTG